MSLIRSFFVQSGRCPLESVAWVRKSSQIIGDEGELIFGRDQIEVPEFWSQTAVDVAVSKYLRKAGVPQPDGSKGPESSVKALIQRVVGRIVEIGVREKYFKDLEAADTFSYELKYILVHQLGAFNSPVWFNCGLFQAYGIKGSGTGFRWNSLEHKVVKTESAYEYPQTSACFIQSVDDRLESIFELVKKEALIFKYGSGTGTNFSKIRGHQEPLEGGGNSSGLIAFLEVLDRGAGATKSGGVTRRAAKMVCLDADHPEIRDFVVWKAREEKKAQTLIASGMADHFDGESYQYISGQNSNNSVRLNDEFFKSLQIGGNWKTTARTNGAVVDEFPASELWDLIAKCAWECADPGVQYDSTIQSWNTCKSSGSINASNPCSEYMFLDETACNLASINLVKFLEVSGQMNWEAFHHTIRVLFIAQDILVSASSYPTAEICEKVHRFRPLGLGYTNLGSFLMRKGLVYGSLEACEWTALLTAEMQLTAQSTSRRLATELNPFKEFELNKKSIQDVFDQHIHALKPFLKSELLGDRFQELKNRWEKENRELQTTGLRNAQLTAIAPTGTIGLLMDCDTLGIEPEYALVKLKKLSGGGTLKLLNRSVEVSLQNLNYSKEEIKDILEYVLDSGTMEGAPHLLSDHLAIFDCALPTGADRRRVSTAKHLNTMACAQRFISGALSKTVNLPHDATIKDVKDVFFKAWKLGLKSVAIYRDGSKASQPLNLVNKDIAKDKL